MSDKRFYDDEEAEQILKLASRKQHASGSISRDQLLASASELGISREALEEAEREYRQTYEFEEDRRAYGKHQRAEFRTHLITYLVVNGGLLLLDVRGDGRISWALWVVLFWGLGILLHAAETFLRTGSDYESNFEAWRKRKRRQLTMEDVDTASHLDDISIGVDIRGRKLEAIKQLRERTGLGLKDAKEAVEAYIEQRS